MTDTIRYSNYKLDLIVELDLDKLIENKEIT